MKNSQLLNVCSNIIVLKHAADRTGGICGYNPQTVVARGTHPQHFGNEEILLKETALLPTSIFPGLI